MRPPAFGVVAAIADRSELLPAPFGPMMATISPARDLERRLFDGGHGIVANRKILDAQDRFAGRPHADALSDTPR